MTRTTPDASTAFLAGMRAGLAIAAQQRHLANFRYDKARECDAEIRRAFLDGGAPPDMVEEVLGDAA